MILFLWFALFVLPLPQTEIPQPVGSIEGTVVHAGTTPATPLVNARLELTGAQNLVTRTDIAGRFLFAGLRPGRYRLRITKDGYLREEYGQRAPNMPGVIVTVRSGQALKEINFFLDRAPNIFGQVREKEGGPITDVVIQALRLSFSPLGVRTLTVFSSTRTDDKGEYRLYWLDPGDYIISSTGQSLPNSKDPLEITPGMVYAQTYFPGFVELDNAKPVRVELNREYGGIDFNLARQPFARLVGTTMSRVSGRGLAAKVTLTPPSDGTGVFHYTTISSSTSQPGLGPVGTFAFEGVVPGVYIISAIPNSGERLTTASRIRLRSGDNRMDLELGPGVSMAGRVLQDGDTPMDSPELRIEFTSADPSLPSPGSVPVGRDGSFSVSSAQPGTYIFSVSGLDGNQYLKAAAYGAEDALERPLSIVYSYGEPPSLQIRIGTDGGTVTGSVLDSMDKPFFPAQVTLVPTEDRRHRFEQFHVVATEENGSFSIRGIRPGKYELFAWESIEPRAYLNFDFMRAYEAYGFPLEVKTGPNVPAAIHVIPAQP